MFEKIVLRPDPAGNISAGRLAQALLFYADVHIVFDEASIHELVKLIGVDQTIRLLERPSVRATFLFGQPVTLSREFGGVFVHAFGFVVGVGKKDRADKTGRKDQKPKPSFDRVAERFRLLGGASDGDVKRLIAALGRLVPIRDYGSVQAKLSFTSQEDLARDGVMQESARIVLNEIYVPDKVIDEFKISAYCTDEGLFLFPSMQFDELDAIRRAADPAGKTLSEAGFLGELWNSRIDMAIAAKYGGDFESSNLSSRIIRSRYSEFLRRTALHADQIASFEEVVLEDFPTLREAIDSGERSFGDFLDLLDKAGRFKDWAKGVHPDRELVTAYLTEVSKQHWLEGGKVKALRYVIGQFIAPGGGEVAEAGWNLADAFGLDHLLKKWRPSHFIDDKLKPFVKPDA